MLLRKSVRERERVIMNKANRPRAYLSLFTYDAAVYGHENCWLTLIGARGLRISLVNGA